MKYEFLVDSYASERLKVLSVWSEFRDEDLPVRPRQTADIEMIRADDVNEAYERMLKGDVQYRFVIDNASLAV